jgi:hypothetical protein
MSSISLRLPDSLHKQARELAERDNISINQLIATALAEKMAALLAGEYLAESAQRGSRKSSIACPRRSGMRHPIRATSYSVAAI